MKNRIPIVRVPFLLLPVAGTAVLLGTSAPRAAAPQVVQLEISRIYWEYNASADDLGVHVSLDGEDWKTLKITDPNGHRLFDVRGAGPYAQLGLTELFFEGAEPTLSEFPLQDLL